MISSYFDNLPAIPSRDGTTQIFFKEDFARVVPPHRLTAVNFTTNLVLYSKH